MRSTSSTINIVQLVSALAVIAIGTGLVMAIDLVLPELTDSGLEQNAVRLAVFGVILYGAWLALRRAQFTARARLTAWLAIGVPLFVWQSAVWWLAEIGGFELQIGSAPLLSLAIILPLLIGVPILLRSRTIGRMLDAIPPSWLVGLQVYRVVGSVFLVGWLAGNLPAIPAIPVGGGDTLVGVLALPVALLLTSARGARGVAVAWNVLGILDMLDAVMLNTLTTSGGLQAIVPDRVIDVAAYPLVLIPAFGVPLSLLLHSLSLRQLRRLAARNVTDRQIRPEHVANPIAAQMGHGNA
jgi:hypothetical protein